MVEESQEESQAEKLKRYIGDPKEYIFSERLGLPNDLQDRRVLEIFSGRENESFKRILEKKGASYTSLDLRETIPEGKHVKADAYRLPFKSDSFDHVVMNGPIFWGRSISKLDRSLGRTWRVRDSTIRRLKEWLRVISKKPGSSVRVSQGFSRVDSDYVKESLGRQIRNFEEDYDLFFIPTDDMVKPGEFTYALAIIKK